MKSFLIPLLLLFCCLELSAQIEFSQTQFDLEDINLLNEDVVDLQLKNSTADPIYILRIEASSTVGVKYTSKQLTPGKTETIRVKLNPQQKGKLSETVKLHLSSNAEPTEISIKADVKSVPKDRRQACPDFRTVPTSINQTQNISGVIRHFSVVLYDENEEEHHLAQNRVGEVNTPPPPSEEEKISPVERTARPVRNKKIKKTPEERRNSPSLGTILFGKQDADPIADEPADPQPETPSNQPTEELTSAPEQKLDSNLLSNEFKPNNIVFLIDASTSMREEQKMDILKEAMVELLTPLRSIDYISIITYSGEAKVVLPPTSGDQKEAIAEQIRTLHADGSTNAVKGIKKAIATGKSNFIEDGNNQIFLASDGAFNIGERNLSLRNKIKKTANEGLTIDVIGIKNANWTNKSLKEIAELGEGAFIRIKSMSGASKVLTEVKKKAAK